MYAHLGVRLVAATGEGVVRLVGTGLEWVSRQVLDGGFRTVALDPSDGEVIWAGGGDGVARSSDGGLTWAPTGLSDQDVFSLAVSRADGGVYAGCEPSAVFRSRDRGSSWRELESLHAIPSAPTWSFPPRPWTSHVRWIAPSPHEADRLLVGIELGGVMLSEDGGETWHDHRPGAQRDVHALAWHPTVEGRAYEAGGGGAAWSEDSGRSWQPADEGRDRHYTWALAVHPEDPDCWFVSASRGPFQAHGDGDAQASVYRWRGTGSWQRLESDAGERFDSMPYALAVAGRTLFAGLSDGRILASADWGDRWTELDVGGDPPSALLALVASD